MRLFAFVMLCAAVAPPITAGEPNPNLTMASTTTVDARDPRIAYMGRVALTADGARMGFPGITVRFVYRGPAPILRLSASSANCYFNLACNGWDPVVIHLNQGENRIALPTGKAPAQGWLVELVRRTESWQGVATFEGLELPSGGELLPPPPWPGRKLMFIGDSVTCGECIERFPAEDVPTPRSANAGRSFGMLLGRWLGAQVHLVSYGGRGVMRDWEGKTDVANAPQFFQRTLPDDPAPPWNPADYSPDAIVICLGQNDFNQDLPAEAIYTRAYDDFVGQVRAAHPQAALILGELSLYGETPGTLDRAKRDQLNRIIDTIAARRRAAGDGHIASAPVHYYPGTPTNAHPVAFQHEQIALDLLGPIRALTGW